ncbi:LysM peptidoglycan-binding domain-containing protein, partial [Alicyclobacillus fodiniaquatilis]
GGVQMYTAQRKSQYGYNKPIVQQTRNSLLKQQAKLSFGKKEYRFSVGSILGYTVLLVLALLFVFKWCQPPIYTDWKQVVVQQGDTLWSIATINCPSVTDRQDEIQLIDDINNLKSAQVYPGEVILVPTHQH